MSTNTKPEPDPAKLADQRSLEIAAANGVAPVLKSEEMEDSETWGGYSRADPITQSRMRRELGTKLDRAAAAHDLAPEKSYRPAR